MLGVPFRRSVQANNNCEGYYASNFATQKSEESLYNLSLLERNCSYLYASSELGYK